MTYATENGQENAGDNSLSEGQRRVPLYFKAAFVVAYAMISNFTWHQYDVQFFNDRFTGEIYGGQIFSDKFIFLPLLLLPFCFPERLIRQITLIPTPVFFVAFVCSISLFWSVSPRTSAYYISQLSICIIYPLVLRSFGRAYALSFIWRISITVLALSLSLAVIGNEHVLMQGEHSGAIRGIFPHKNILGPFAGVTMILTVFARKEIKLGGFAYFISLMICGFAIILCRSSTAIMAIIISMLIGNYSIALRHTSNKIISNVVILIIALVSFFTYEAVFALVLDALGKDASLSNRTLLWEVALPFSYNPLGSGYGTSGGQVLQDAIKRSLNIAQGSSVQSAYLNGALEIGWGPVVVFVGWLIFCFAKTLGKDTVCVALISFLLVISFTEVLGGFLPNVILFTLLLVVPLRNTGDFT